MNRAWGGLLVSALAAGFAASCGSSGTSGGGDAGNASGSGDASLDAPGDSAIPDTSVDSASALEASADSGGAPSDSSSIEAGLADGGASDAGTVCTAVPATVTPTPAAMLVVLQASASMGVGGKWPVSQQAIVQAFDENPFDGMALGLTAFPSTTVGAPACYEGIFSNVYCGHYGGGGNSTGPLPVSIAQAGVLKSSAASGVRHDILGWLTSNVPATQDASNDSPTYDAMNAGYAALQATSASKRVLVLITDGGFSCAAVSSPTRPGLTDGLCPAWEYPTTLNALIASMRTSATAPVETFVIGLPGSNSYANEMQGSYTAAPYSMPLALSTYAVSGSPATVPAGCDSSAVWTQTGAAPAAPCHMDLSSSSQFSAAALGGAIEDVRREALGCSFTVAAPDGGSVDPTTINVQLVVNGTSTSLPRRASAGDACAQNPCWDLDASGNVDLIGAACTAFSSSSSAAVSVGLGCPTQTCSCQ